MSAAAPSPGPSSASEPTAASPPSLNATQPKALVEKRCNTCNGADHLMHQCSNRICTTCGGCGHWAGKCGSSLAWLGVAAAANMLPTVGSVGTGEWYVSGGRLRVRTMKLTEGNVVLGYLGAFPHNALQSGDLRRYGASTVDHNDERRYVGCGRP